MVFIPESEVFFVCSAIVFKVFQLGPTKHSLQKKILFHVDLIKMLSLIPVIFSSKFRIAKIHVLPFQVIKSSHSWATHTYHCIRCVRNWVCWRDPYYPQPILRVHYNSFRQKLLHSHSVELIGLVILCVFFPFRLLSVLPGFVYKRPRLDLVFCCCYFPSLLCWLKLKSVFCFKCNN